MKTLAVKALTISACLGVFGVAIPQTLFTPPATAQVQDSLNNWGFSISRVGYPGRTAKTEYGDYEAAGTWIAVEVVVQNRTNERLKAVDGLGYAYSADVVDTNGHKYDSDHIIDKSDDKPFRPGETRSVVLLFDVPSGTKASQLVLKDFNDNVVRLALR